MKKLPPGKNSSEIKTETNPDLFFSSKLCLTSHYETSKSDAVAGDDDGDDDGIEGNDDDDVIGPENIQMKLVLIFVS